MAVGADSRWEAGIGDPSLAGWATAAAYLLAAGLAARNATSARRSGVPAGFWVTLAVAMLLLGINKQLDLQSWFGQTGRDLALSQGWYEHRRGVQLGFIALLCVGTAAVLLGARRVWIRLWHEYRWAFGGVCVLATFIVIRAASFHHIDQLFRFDLGATNFGRALEVIGVLIVAWACWDWYAMHRRRVRRFVVERAIGARPR